MNRYWIGFALCVVVCGCRTTPRPPPNSQHLPDGAAASRQVTSQNQSPARLPSTNGPQLGSANRNAGPARVTPENVSNHRQNRSRQPRESGIQLTQAQLPNGPESLPTPPADHNSSRRRQAPTVLSLPDALAVGLAQNPDLITLRGTANVGAAAVDVAGVYPWNPFVQAQYLPNGSPYIPGSPGNASGQSNYYIWVMQRFELAHQTQHREDSALAALGQIRWNIQQAELLNVAQTERLYFAAVYQRQLHGLAADAETLSERLAGIIQRRFRAGLATSVQNINAQVALRQTRRQRELAEATYEAAKLALIQQLGLPPLADFDLQADLTRYEWFSVSDAARCLSGTQLDDPQLLAQDLTEARPDVLAARSAIAMARANMNLARAARVQDIQAGPIVDTADDGTKFIGLRLQRDFGVFNNGKALVNQRAAEVRQQNLTYMQLKRRASNEALAAIDRYERARRLVSNAARLETGNPPPELAQVLREFEAGNAQIVDVVAVQNNLLQETRAYIDLLNEVAQAAADVTQTTAIPPQRLVAERPPRFVEPAAP